MAEHMRSTDRCDRCQSEAFLLAIKGKQHLLFCIHHGRLHKPVLEAKGWSVLDESDRMTAQPPASVDA
jgi:hypothetical protein